jgi:hypothetical protein
MVRVTQRVGIRGAAVLATVLIAAVVPTALAGASSVSSSPQGVRVSQAAGLTQVRWVRPASNGGALVTRYVALARPSGATCVSKTTNCVFSRLTPGGTYTVTVVADNAAGASAPSAPSNRFRVLSAKASFLSAITAFNSQFAIDQESISQVISGGGSETQLDRAISKLQLTYGNLTEALGHDEWPLSARTDVASLITDSKHLSADWKDSYEESTSDPGPVLYTLQADANKQILADAKVRTDLGLPELITGPIATSPTGANAVGVALSVHDFSGDELSVTATQIIDPATAGAGSGLPDSGFQFVAVDLTLSNPGGGGVEGNANFSTTVKGSDGQTYTADFGTASECENFTFGLFDLPGGDTATGCVLFELPSAVSVQTVMFSIAPGYLDTAVWTN